jgi:hypothetical protein
MVITNGLQCSVCMRKTRSTDKCLKCSICNSPVHIKCLPSYNQNDIDYASDLSNNWSCTICLRSLFPFYNLESNQDLINYNTQNISNLDPEKAKDLIFDPFAPIIDDN